MATTKPTIEEIQELLNWVKQHYATLHSEFDLDDLYYDLAFRNDLKLPAEYAEDAILLATARDIIDTATDHLSTAVVRFFRPQRGNTPEDKAQAEMLRKADTGLFYRIKLENAIPPWRTVTKHGFLYGMYGFKVVYDPKKWPDKPQENSHNEDEYKELLDAYKGKLHDAMPMSITAIHPKILYPDPTGAQPRFVFEISQKPFYALKKDWPKWNPGVGSISPQSMFEEVQYWDDDYRAVLVGAQPVSSSGTPGSTYYELALPAPVVRHRYGQPPYIIGYSGLGNESDTGAPEKRAVGLIRFMRSQLAAESAGLSIFHIIMKGNAWPIKMAQGPNASSLTGLKLHYGRIAEIPEGVTLTDWTAPFPTEALLGYIQTISSRIEGSAMPRAVQGRAQQGVRSYAAQSSMLMEARLKYEGMKENLEKDTARVMALATKIQEHIIPGNVSVWAKTATDDFDIEVTRSKIKGHYITYAEFSPVQPEEDIRRHADAINLVKAGLTSADTARRRYLTHIDPNAEEIKVAAETLRMGPGFRQILEAYAAQKLQKAIQKATRFQVLVDQTKAQGGAGMSQMQQAMTRMPPATVEKAPPPGTVGEAQQLIQSVGQAATPPGIAPPGGIG